MRLEDYPRYLFGIRPQTVTVKLYFGEYQSFVKIP